MHSHMVTSYRFFGGTIALHGVVHFLNTTGPSLTKVVYTYVDRISHEEYDKQKWSQDGMWCMQKIVDTGLAHNVRKQGGGGAPN